MSQLAGLEVKTVNDERVVTFLGVKLAAFHVVSDDYAYTHAGEFAKSFQHHYMLEESIRMTMDKRVDYAAGKAWAGLS